MQELVDLAWIEKYRPSSFEDLVLNDKSLILNYLKNPLSMPSFIFHSVKPGTGKTSLAKLIIKELGCDDLPLNASDERGIDTIRDKVNLFSRSMSSRAGSKRCVFLDEADSMTKQAQDSLRNLMEEYSDNVFFIFSANDYSKIIEPIRSRCQSINFERPDKAGIEMRLLEICQKEDMRCNLSELLNTYYPDMRKMIGILQESKISGKEWTRDTDDFELFFGLMKKRDIKPMSDKVYSGSFDIMGFNKWLFAKLFEAPQNYKNLDQISLYLADTEKHWTLQANLEIIFLSNILQIIKLL